MVSYFYETLEQLSGVLGDINIIIEERDRRSPRYEEGIDEIY